ncbi:MAG: hypothetical protein ACRC6X_06675 [Culicoidibacterales bacterium]
MAKKASLFYLSINRKITEDDKNHKRKDNKPKFYEAIAKKRKKK